MPSRADIAFPRFAFISDPTPEQIRRDLVLLTANIKDYRKPLMYSKQVLIDDVKNAFDSETDPVTNVQWPALSARAEREPHVGGRMLQRSRTNRRMYRAVTNKNHWGVSKQGVFLNQGRVLQIAPYAVYHQQDDSKGGTPKAIVPTKQAVLNRAKSNILERRRAGQAAQTAAQSVTEAHRQLTQEYAAAAKKAGFTEAGEGTIPQRRFIGPSQYTQQLTVKAMDEWADDAIRIYKRGGRMVKARRPLT